MRYRMARPDGEEQKIPILMYHSIAARVKRHVRRFTVSPSEFEQQMSYLSEMNYNTMTVSQFVLHIERGERLPARLVLLTFDDGFADFYTTALPILKHYGFLATLYIPTAFIDSSSKKLESNSNAEHPMLNWKQVMHLVECGIECGAHSHSHPQLDVLPIARAQDEILRSKHILEEKLGREILTFAYPFGYYHATTQQLVQQAGYTSACAVRYAMSSPCDDRYALSRLIVPGGMTLRQFNKLLAGRGQQLSPGYERARALIWRAARRSISHLSHRSLAGKAEYADYV